MSWLRNNNNNNKFEKWNLFYEKWTITEKQQKFKKGIFCINSDDFDLP